MAWRKSYCVNRKYDEHVTRAEEVSFLENYKHQMIQLDPKDTILVLCHSDNTFDKHILRDGDKYGRVNPKMKKTTYNLNDFIKEKSNIHIKEFIELLA
jgi:hypothetical protein